MADLVIGAMGRLIPKLCELLKEEYNLQTNVKERIKSFSLELEHAQAALRKVAQVPWDQLDEQVQLWAREVREASYDVEDVLDVFVVRVQDPDSVEQEKSLLKPLKKIAKLLKTSMARCKISGDVKDIMTHLKEVAKRCRRYKVDEIMARPDRVSTVDPRLHAMYTQVNKLVGIDESSSELRSKLQLDDMSNTKMKTVSIVGIGGLGKTTLAKAVYDHLRGDFNCRAFVSVGRNPDLQKVLQMILIALDHERYEKFNFAVFHDITQYINKLRDFLHVNKRYFIVIDDLWEKRSWETLKLAIADDKSYEGRIIVTTRNWEVAKNADEVYKLPPLPYDSSKKLFYSRIYGDDIKYIDYQQPDEVSDEILRKCAGVPLAIITMASLLVDEPRDRWFEVYKSIGFGGKENEEAENIMNKILSFSYYDLPWHLRACLLYLSAFPEDSVIPKVPLVWMWAAEGFIQKQKGKGLFEIGVGYFNDLVNRSLIQEEEPDHDIDFIHGCRVHDMVLDFIRSMSHEENFITVFDNNDQGTLVQKNVLRRLAHHNKVMLHGNEASMFDMSKVRSFIALEWVIDKWIPLSSFKLLRVLYIKVVGDGSLVRIRHPGHLLHLRYLGIRSKRHIEKIPEDLGALKMLQTLDLSKSIILEVPSSCSLPTQLVCLRLRIHIDESVSGVDMFSVGRLTCLEELSIQFECAENNSRQLVKELGTLRELRVLIITLIYFEDEEMERDLIESVNHLHKLQRLQISAYHTRFLEREITEFVLPGYLRTLGLDDFVLWKLPSCIDPLCHRKLSHLDLCLSNMDEQDLKTLGRLPELRFLGLDMRNNSSSKIDNISDYDVCYFPKLMSLRLMYSLVLFVATKGDDNKKTVSFHIWLGGEDDIPPSLMPSVSDDELGDYGLSSLFQCETSRDPVDEKTDGELQLLSTSDDVDTSRPSFQPSKSPVSDVEKKQGSISTREGEGKGTATPQFMPRLHVLEFFVPYPLVWDPCCCNNLGLEFLSSLREIRVGIDQTFATFESYFAVEAVLMRVAQLHPNHPELFAELRI